MKTFVITASSNNEKSLTNFLKLLRIIFKKNLTNTIKLRNVKKTKNFMTILKSPHVNKTAQEQFEKREFLIKTIIITENSGKILIVLKKIFNKLFSDIKLTVKLSTGNQNIKSNRLNVLKNINFKINNGKKTGTNNSLQTKVKLKKRYLVCKEQPKVKIYTDLLNNYGETQLVHCK